MRALFYHSWVAINGKHDYLTIIWRNQILQRKRTPSNKKIGAYFFTSDDEQRIFPDLRFYLIPRIFRIATNGVEMVIFRWLTR